MIKKSYRPWLGTALALGMLSVSPACQAPGANAVVVKAGALVASAAAQSFGITSYTTDDHNVWFYGSAGQLVGSLAAAQNGVETRVILIAMTDGRQFRGEVVRPLDGVFVLTVPDSKLDGAVETDPVLVPFFNKFQISFTAQQASAPNTVLGPEALGACSDPGFLPGSFAVPFCNLMPGTCVVVSDKTVNGVRSIQRNYDLTCAPIDAADGGECDGLDECDHNEKQEYCTDPGSCIFANFEANMDSTNVSIACTTVVPASPATHNCATVNGKKLTVGRTGTNSTQHGNVHGGPTMNPGKVFCQVGTVGISCIAGFYPGDTITLTATPNDWGGSSTGFVQWTSGACVGSSSNVCSFTAPSTDVTVVAQFENLLN